MDFSFKNHHLGDTYKNTRIVVEAMAPVYTLEEGQIAVRIARDTVDSHVKNETLGDVTFPEKFSQKSGVFVTLTTHPGGNLRGCIGFPEPVFKLKHALIKAAREASTGDPRFPPVKPDELGHITVEVSILTPPELVKVRRPKHYLKEVVVGRDGLIVEAGNRRGLLLPQVPVEWNWDVRQFLEQTCMKAGLFPDTWLDKHAKLYRFTAEIFRESEPRGGIVSKPIA